MGTELREKERANLAQVKYGPEMAMQKRKAIRNLNENGAPLVLTDCWGNVSGWFVSGGAGADYAIRLIGYLRLCLLVYEVCLLYV